MKEKIRMLLEEALPLIDFDSDFLFSELDSLGVTTILMMLSDEFGIELEATDATPKNLKTLDSIVALVEKMFPLKRLAIHQNLEQIGMACKVALHWRECSEA